MSKRAVELLPWLVNEKLEDGERAQARAVLESDEEARELLRYAELLREGIGEEETVSSRLLIEYAERPEQLGEEVRERIARLLENDSRAQQAVTILRDLQAAETRAEETPEGREEGGGARGFEIERAAAPLLAKLRDVVLRPVPAFVPAGLLAAMLLLLWIGPPRGGGVAGTSPGVVPLLRLTSEDQFRSGAPTGEPAGGSSPAVGAAVRERAWVLELVTGMDLDELPERERRELALELLLTGPAGPVLERQLEVADFEEGSTVRLLIPPRTVVDPGSYRIEIRYRTPGSPLDGLVGFETGFTVLFVDRQDRDDESAR